MTELISSDKFFSDSQRDVLAVLADMMIPAEGIMPGAADADILRVAMESMSRHRDLVARSLAAFADMIGREDGRHFADLSPTERLTLVDRLKSEQADFIRIFETHILASYYRDDRVLTALGLPARAPFPEGNTIAPTDWSLLDPVRHRKPFYRIV